MSDDEDMIMDETNQVCIPSSLSLHYLFLQSSYGGGDDDDEEGTRGSGSRQK